jgi:lysine 6-dehydrogenase
MGNVREMWEKTIRWPGHAEKMMTLRELGFFDKTGVKIGELEVKPVDLTIKMLKEKLKEEEDVIVLIVEVIGYMGDVYVEAKYKLIDYYDRELKVTAMGRTTGYTAALIAKMIMKGKVKGKGVIPPENLLTKEGIEELFKELWNRGIRIDEEVVYKKTSW